MTITVDGFAATTDELPWLEQLTTTLLQRLPQQGPLPQEFGSFTGTARLTAHLLAVEVQTYIGSEGVVVWVVIDFTNGRVCLSTTGWVGDPLGLSLGINPTT